MKYLDSLTINYIEYIIVALPENVFRGSLNFLLIDEAKEADLYTCELHDINKSFYHQPP